MASDKLALNINYAIDFLSLRQGHYLAYLVSLLGNGQLLKEAEGILYRRAELWAVSSPLQQ